tara:strand:- start:60 stop:431 length:372 start_codon:yes stop_codon:yes gene_type:complete
MAHFAELDENNIVLRVCVVDNAYVPSDMHIDGETWCENFWGGTWKQTSYNHNFRKRYAGIGHTYDAAKDKFIEPQFHPSWSLDENDDWKAPVEYPADGDETNWYKWDESVYQGDNTKGWVAVE